MTFASTQTEVTQANYLNVYSTHAEVTVHTFFCWALRQRWRRAQCLRWCFQHVKQQHTGRGDILQKDWGKHTDRGVTDSSDLSGESTHTEVTVQKILTIWLALRQRWMQAPVRDEHNGEGDVSKMQNRSIQVEVTSLEIAFGKHTVRGDSSDLSDEGTHAEVTVRTLLWWALRQRWLEALVRDKHMAKLVYQRRQTEAHRQRWHLWKCIWWAHIQRWLKQIGDLSVEGTHAEETFHRDLKWAHMQRWLKWFRNDHEGTQAEVNVKTLVECSSTCQRWAQ